MMTVLLLKNPYGDGKSRLFPIDDEKMPNLRREIAKFFHREPTHGLHFTYVDFPLGQVVITAELAERMEEYRYDIAHALEEHRFCNWGLTKGSDWWANFRALKSGERILSEWEIGGERVWIITDAENDEGKREHTTIMRPSDY